MIFDNLRSRALLASSIAAVTLVAAPAAAQVIDFETGPTGVIADGYTTGGITFTTALGSGLEIGNFTPSTAGRGLIVRSDSNGNFLRGAIAGGTNYLSFDFGNDDPLFTLPTDLATLRVYSGLTLLDTITLGLNRDDVMNQTIGYSGGLFDNFEFAYTNAAGSPFTGGVGTNIGLIEAVDNFRLVAPGAVPEPATWLMMILGFGAIGGMMRGKRRETVRVRYA